MKRRTVVQLAAAMLASPGWVLAQTPRRFRLGLLLAGNETTARSVVRALIAGLRDRGYVVGDNLVLDIRYAEGDAKRFPVLADELIALKPDVLLGVETSARVMAAKTKSIPIVLLTSIDPVAAGLVKSLARPGTNVTGMTDQFDQMIAKHVELLLELVPNASRLALINDAHWSAGDRYERFARTAAEQKGLRLMVVPVSIATGVDQACAQLQRERPDGLVVGASGALIQLRHEIIACVQRLRLPAIYALPMYAESGGLLSYSPDLHHSFRNSVAEYVARMLKGANPGELPVQQTAKYEFAINLKTARHIGIAIPASLLVRADRVIE